MSYLFHLILSQPLFNLLVFLYTHVTFYDFGLSVILLTVIIRLILYPLFYKAMKNQATMQKIQPEISRVQREHKENKELQAAEMMKIWKAHKVNPFSSLVLVFIQLPILIALYRLFQHGFSTELMSQLYSFVGAPRTINTTLLGLINLAKPNMIIVGLAAVSQYFQSWLALPKKAAAGADGITPKQPGRQMVYLAPILTLLILPSLSATIGLYWLTGSLFSILQQKLINNSVYGKHPANKN
jgi:YidC/Oxa1 family membrane protein insertase